MEQLKQELEKAKSQLRGAEKMGAQKFIDKAKDKIADIEAKISAHSDMNDNKPTPLKTKATIVLNEPKDVDSYKTKKEIEDLMLKKGHKSSEISLTMKFTTDNPKSILDKFQVLKNDIAFNRDLKKAKKAKPVKKVIDVKKALDQGEKSGLEGSLKFDENGNAKAKYKSIVKKVSDTTYMVLYKGDTNKDAELHLKNGKWEITCCELKEYPEFSENQLSKAIGFILDFKDCLYSRMDRVAKKKEEKKIHEKYAKTPDVKKAENAVDKAAESVENRVNDLLKEGKEITYKQAKPIASDVINIAKSIAHGIKDKSERKEFISDLIKELESEL